MAHELKAKHIQTETLENKADDRIQARNILTYVQNFLSNLGDNDLVPKNYVDLLFESVGIEKYKGSYETLSDAEFEITDPEIDDLIVIRGDKSIYWYDGSSWESVGGSTETPATIKTKYESNENTNAFTDAEKSKLSGIATGATKNANTDELSEGTNNKYFTEARAIAAKIVGYVKAGTPIPLAETDSILQALGKLEGLLDTKIPIRGDNFIATRPTANKAANGTHLQNIINELASFTPGGNPLSHTNRAYVLVMPGEYNGDIYLEQPYIDIIGFGSKNGNIINGNIETYFVLNKDHRIENLTVKGTISCYGHTEVCVYRNLAVDTFLCDTLGTFENIEHSGAGDYLFESLSGGVLKNIYTPKALGSYASIDFEGTIEDCRVEGQHEPIGVSGNITRSYFKGNNGYDAILELYDGAEISYTTIINESDEGTGNEWAVTNYNRYGAPDTDKEVRIHHCHFVAKDGALSPKVINTIENGHNTWDSEGGEGDGIQDIIEGTNVIIDKTDPKNPIISSSGGESTTLDESFEI